jgi:hypothetical protein
VNNDADEGTGDKVAAWLLYVLQLVWELALFILLVASVMAGDACGTGAGGIAEPRVCSGAYFATIFYGFAFVLLVAAIAVPVLIIRAGRRRWLRPVLGIVLLTIAAVVYVGLVSQ